MKNFVSFLNESYSATDAYKESVKIIEFLSKKTGQDYVEIDGQNFTNSTGNYFGYLFASKTDNSAIRINWSGNNFHSISFWLDWNFVADPAKEITVEGAEPGKSAFAKLLPDIAAIIKDVNSFDSDENEEPLEESMLTEHKVEYDGQIYLNKADLVVKLYEDDVDLKEIMKITNLNALQIKSIITKHLFTKGGSVSEIADAVGAENNAVRKFVNSPDEEDTTVEYDERIKVNAGAKETIVSTKFIKKGETQLEETEYADPDLVFDDINNYVTMTAKGLLPSLLITGQGTIGKYYNIEKELNEVGKQNETWVKIKGKVTAEDIYTTLWKNRDKVVVFEDCDGIFKDAESVQLLMDLVDSGEMYWKENDKKFVDTTDLDDNETIEQACEDWSAENKGKEGIPNHFVFEGQTIIISNLSKTEIIKVEPELLNKCTCIDIIIAAQNSMKRLETILSRVKIYKTFDSKGTIGKDITDEDTKLEVFDYMCSDEFVKNPKRRGKESTFRTFDSIYKVCYAGLDNWKELGLSAE